MAKSPQNTASAPAEQPAENPNPNEGAATAAGAIDDRFRTVRDPETGQVVKRQDFIRRYWQEKKMSRGDIAKKLTELNSVENGGTGKKIPYQIVFAATKKLPGGPDKTAETAAAPAEGSAG